jgi:RNA polymerase sigma factor (sigma-70 family)
MSNSEDEEKRNTGRYYIPIDGKLYETNEIVYKTYYKMDRRERYLEERDIKKNVITFTDLDIGTYRPEEMISDKTVDIEDEIINRIMIEAVLEAITNLEEEEKWLIQELFFCGKSEREVAEESGISRRTIGYRKNVILEKLRKIKKY